MGNISRVAHFHKTKSLSLTLAAFLFFLNSCGDGSFVIDRSQGAQTGTVAVPGSESPLEFFTDEIFPLITRSEAQGGCAVSGCHLVNDAAEPEQTFHQVDPGDADNTFNWAGARRKVLVQGTFAGPTSLTYKQQMDGNHESFQNWSDDDRAKLNDWVNLP